MSGRPLGQVFITGLERVLGRRIARRTPEESQRIALKISHSFFAELYRK
jgi:hypothetical protein